MKAIKDTRSSRPTKSSNKRSEVTPSRSKKTAVLKLEIPRADLAIVTAFADHFALDPSVVMEAGLLSELEALGDDIFSTLAFAAELSPAKDLVTVNLHILPEVIALLDLVASLLNRPSTWLASVLVRDDARLMQAICKEVEAGADETNLEDWAKRIVAIEFETRRGRMPRGDSGLDAWSYLNLQNYRPTRFPTPAAKKGGEKS